MKKRKPIVVKPFKMWNPGDSRVEPYMGDVAHTISKYFKGGTNEWTDIYNRAYEAVWNVIRDYDKK